MSNPAIEWIEANCRHPRAAGADLYGKPVKLMEYQRKILNDCFGPDGLPKKQNLVIVGPRKIAKSSLAASILTYLVAGSRTVGANIPISAASLDQGRVLFGLTADMIRLLEDHSWKVLNDVIENKATGNKIWMASSNWRGLYSHIPTAVAIEEVAMHESEKPIVSLVSGLASAKAPFVIWLSNPPPTIDHPFFFDHLKLWRKEKRKKNSEYSVWLFSAPQKDDPFSMQTIKKANPAFREGQVGNEKFFRAQMALAKTSPEKQLQYRQLVLGQIVASRATDWINGLNWRIFQRAAGPGRLWIGADFSLARDKTAVCYAEQIEKVGWFFDVDFYLPEAALEFYSEKRREQILNHSEKGWIKVQKSERVTNTDLILKDVLAKIDQAEAVEGVAIDPNAGGAPFMQKIENALPHCEVISASSYPKALTAPINFLTKLDQNKEFLYSGNGQLLDSFRNTLLTSRQSRNYKSVCRKHDGDGYSIDGTMAALYALQSFCNEKRKEYLSPQIV